MLGIQNVTLSALVALFAAACGDSSSTQASLDSGPHDEDDKDASSSADAEEELDAESRDEDAGADAADEVDASNLDAGAEGDAGDSDAAEDSDAGTSQSVVIRFKGKVGEADFACGQTYMAQGSAGTSVQPLDFRFFVQDLRLIDGDGQEVPVVLDTIEPWQSPTLALIDFEDATGLCVDGNTEMNTEIHGSVPKGSYQGVAFANGVPEALNHTNPTDQTNPPPLRTAYKLQWAWLSGYRFLKAEVSEVTDGGVPGAGKGVAHPGSQACTGSPVEGTVVCARPNRNEVRLTNFDPETNVIIADLGALFAHTDLSTTAQCHSTGDACPAMFEQLGIDYDAGTPLPTQAVYRVE